MTLHPTIARVTDRIRARSATARGAYLDRMARAVAQGPARAHLACGNQAHAYAAMGEDKAALAADRAPNIGIVTAYNDMLSAHQPFEALSRPDPRGRAPGGRHGAGRGRRAGDVRRRHAGPAGDGAVALLARRDRAGRRGGAEPQLLRRGALSRRLRQDRAGPHHGGGDLRPCPGGLRARRADDHRPAERREVQGPQRLCRRARPAATS